MRPEERSNHLLGIIRAKAKMIEYHVPEQYQNIDLSSDPAKLFTLSIGLLGDFAAGTNREEDRSEVLVALRKNMLFSAHFFDSYLQSRLNETIDFYLSLLGSSSYYLCDLPGSATVLAKHIAGRCRNLEGEGLEKLLLWLLQSDFSITFEGSDGLFGDYIETIHKLVSQYFKSGNGEEKLIDLARNLRGAVYESGTPRQLLFGDIIVAVLIKMIQNSSWKALPLYSGIPRDKWLIALQKESFIKELWPAQHLLGQAGVFRGKSAVVQMPTSAGKTKAIELVIRSAFLADRTSLAIIIAPFRALCHEIKNSLVSSFYNESTKVDELSDVLQTDFEIVELLGHKQILVVTPEKLLYVLRHDPELASNVGLLIFDEGHQFDSGTRGITYELLLTFLRSILSDGAQKVLVSAVISNAEAVGEWLNGDPKVVEGTNLNPTFRSVGFASWLDRLGRIEYIDGKDAEKGEFFVPRVIESLNLGKTGREKIDRFFPEKSDGQAIALYLGLKLAPNGSIAIFCGRKTTAASICEKSVAIIERGISLPLPKEYSDQQEVERLHYLHVENLGPDSPATKSAVHGIFSHHGNTPHGIRLAVEYAMREGFVRFVVCTSTLAQGVNLPIRYLIVTSVYQGIERIRVRDFHNLIGRVGRAGMHTEGSVLFADPIVYDKKRNRRDSWRWKQIKTLLDQKNSEPCTSNLLSIFDPIKSDDDKSTINMEPLDFVRAYIGDPGGLSKFTDEIVRQNAEKGFTRGGVERQIAWKISLITSIESFLLSQWDEKEEVLSEVSIAQLAQETFAFFLADEQKREHILELFKLLAANISNNITDPRRRRIYGRTLYGLKDVLAIEIWVQGNLDQLLVTKSMVETLNLIWPQLIKYIHNSFFKKFDNPEVLKEITQEWIEGESFHNILEIIQQRKARIIWGTQRRDFKIGHIVDICEGGFAYDGALLLGALTEILELIDQDGISELVRRLQLFQKQIKYGLPTRASIHLYEIGFSDRVIALDLARSFNLDSEDKQMVLRILKSDTQKSIEIIDKYPSYFQLRMKEILKQDYYMV
jgi:POLQ-like helicase